MMMFFRSPKAIETELKKKLSDSDRHVRKIKDERATRVAAFDDQVVKIKEHLEGVLNGSTPDNLDADLKSLRAWLRGGAPSGSDLQPVPSTA